MAEEEEDGELTRKEIIGGVLAMIAITILFWGGVQGVLYTQGDTERIVIEKEGHPR